MDIQLVSGPSADLEAVRKLFVEYAESLGFSLCFQGFDQELATLPGDYAPPQGCLLLAKEDGEAAGCVGVRRLDAERCEMKRLYVRIAFRGTRLGRKLAEAALAAAREAGYRRMVLDTLPAMKAARTLYSVLGFKPCAPYYDNACIGSDCFELTL
ncbi:MAG: GNAT family N-acetyltransferase [Burkholderiales bacterium]|nr:GNAT family N-acetyltransferase [Burkholderiales bacterium]